MSHASSSESRQWHAMTEEAIFHALSTGDQGLEASEIPHRIEQFGLNTLEAEAGVRFATLVWHQVRHPLIYLLAGAAALSLVAGHPIDAAVIAGVIALNTALGVLQEWKAGRAMEALSRMAAPHARVLRDGQEQKISAEEVLPGDILLLETGDRVAADARIIQSAELRTDESALTGESEAVAKAPGVVDAKQPMAEQRNMVWSSSAVTAGRGRAVVIATGMNTSLGHIAGQVRQSGREQTPLQVRLARLGAILGVTGIALAGVVFLLGLLRGYPFFDMVFYALATAVSAIPEGLPAVISVTLALGVERMARRNAIVRRLPAVETLGSTTVICSDKTGTITRNEMTVTRLWTYNRAYAVTGAGFEPSGEIQEQDAPDAKAALGPDVELLALIGALNNNAVLSQEPENGWRINGAPTEGALLVASHKAGRAGKETRKSLPRLSEIPFSSERKYMATLHPREEGQGVFLCVKGAPDRVLSFCEKVMIDGEAVPLTEALRAEIEGANASFAGQALRVIAAAVKFPPEQADALTHDAVESGLAFVGLWGIVDPPRPEAVRAIADARGAGIRVVMITGDHAITAGAIAREVGIAAPGDEAVSGAELDEMTEAELVKRVRHINVFARVSPAHKLRILQALKKNGEIVAMTGDGVNDAPALKGADIGVAMGKSGTEVAREAADMVLMDDDFATIMHAVEEGRVIFSNLRRTIFFLITTNMAEVITLALALMAGMPLPLTAIMILWINLVTDGACTIPLGIEPKHWDVLKQPPRAPGAGVLDKALLRRMLILAPIIAAGTLGLYAYELFAGSELHAQTVAFTTLAAFQWFQAISARSTYVSVFSIGLFKNVWLWFGVTLAIILQLLVIHTPAGRMLFGVEALSFVDWVLIVTVASSVFFVDEALKYFGVHGTLGKPLEPGG